MDSGDHYLDPFGEALSHSSSRAAQMISLAAAAAEVAARRVADCRGRTSDVGSALGR
jgi:hypothetical protein